MNSHNSTDKSGVPPARATRLLDQVREQIRSRHYSLRTEEAYVFWIKKFVRFHGLRHPRDMAREEVEAFLSHLATARKVAVSTHRQALSPLLFLCPHVLGMQLPSMDELVRPLPRKRIPVAFTGTPVQAVLDPLDGHPPPPGL